MLALSLGACTRTASHEPGDLLVNNYDEVGPQNGGTNGGTYEAKTADSEGIPSYNGSWVAKATRTARAWDGTGTMTPGRGGDPTLP